MSEDEIKAWFFKYGQYANGRDMALIHAIAEAVAPQRTWVGLTDEEVRAVIRAGEYDSMEEFARAIEAKLKEKNSGA